MSNDQKLKQLLQRIMLTITGSHLDEDDLLGEEGELWIAKLLDWINLWLNEMELEADWQYLRDYNAELATVPQNQDDVITITYPNFRKLVNNEYVKVKIYQGDAVVSEWSYVEPNSINNYSDDNGSRITIINDNLIFSREFQDYELGGKIKADVIRKFPEVTRTDTTALNLVRPEQLVVLGVAKNMTLPDYVSGVLSPSFVQKYQDLLDKAIAENNKSSVAENYLRSSFSYIGRIE